MLGFTEPEKVNLNSYRYGIVHGHELLFRDASEWRCSAETRRREGVISFV